MKLWQLFILLLLLLPHEVIGIPLSSKYLIPAVAAWLGHSSGFIPKRLPTARAQTQHDMYVSWDGDSAFDQMIEKAVRDHKGDSLSRTEELEFLKDLATTIKGSHSNFLFVKRRRPLLDAVARRRRGIERELQALGAAFGVESPDDPLLGDVFG